MSSSSSSEDSGDDADIMDSFNGVGMRQLLAEAGVDPSQDLDYVLAPGGRKRAQAFKIDENELDNDKYFVDADDDDLPDEQISPEEEVRRQRQREQEDRYARLALQTATKEVQKRKAQPTPTAPVIQLSKEEIQEAKRRKIMADNFPNFKKGERVKFTEVLYAQPKSPRKKLERGHVVQYNVPLPPSGLDASSTFASTSSLPSLSQPGRSSKDPMTSHLSRHFDNKQIRAIQRSRAGAPVKHEVQIQVDWVQQITADRKGKGKELDSSVMMVDLIDWEKDIVFDSRNPTSLEPRSSSISDLAKPRNQSLLDGSWLNDIVWDSLAKQQDLEEVEEMVRLPVASASQDAGPSTVPELDPFNLSNDHLYAAAHGGAQQFRIRQTFGNIEVVHAGPAKSLQLPFYKTSLSKTEARSWRRPALQFPVGVSISFSKLKSNKDSGRGKSSVRTAADMAERLRTTKDLTLSEKGAFVLFEFSEEYPPIMSGFGMGTTIVNYYRKKNDKDETIPKLELGEPAILDPGDAEPYLLGYVDPGKVTQSLYNNLIRAPLFKHTPEPTDFLVIRQTINNQPNYYVREIKNLFTVGQTYPNESEVPGPHARKNTNLTKNRLMIVAWSLIQRTKGQRIKLSKLMKYFPDQTELQMRQRFKTKGNDFMIYLRQGPDQGYWKLNPDFVGLPVGRANVQSLVTPESAMLYEAMQVGARHLHDAGYSKTADGGVEDDMGEGGPRGEGLDIEQQLAVWTTTTNYKQAESGKAWLVLHGEGDPTGRGEGYSFLKTSMKGFFLRRGETEADRKSRIEGANKNKISNAEQARIYEEEKRKIWDAQAATLGSSRPPELDEEDEEAERAAQRQKSENSRRGFSRASSSHGPGGWQHESPRGRSPSAMSRASSMDRDDASVHSGRGEDPQGRILRIKRVIRGKVEYEILRDDNIINAYLASLKTVREKAMLRSAENLRATGDPETDAMARRVLQEEIEKFKKNQARRLARKGDRGDDENRTGVQRRCGACGQIGHTRSNSKACPMFGQNAIDPSPSASTPGGQAPMPFGGFGLGMDMGRQEAETSGTGKLILKLAKNS